MMAVVVMIEIVTFGITEFLDFDNRLQITSYGL
jgi:hypothetical protein